MSTPYRITVQLGVDTLKALLDGGYALLAFQPAQATAAGGQPALWIRATSLAANVTISWEATYAAYVSESQIVTNEVVLMQSSAPIELGQVLQVGQDGNLQVTNDGPADAMSVLNTTSNPYTCGLAAMNGGSMSPIAAFPLYGNSMDAMAPVAQALLVFESYPAAVGQILDRTLAQALLVDVSSGIERVVAFDINKGWSFDGSWAKTIPANTGLSRTLIHQSSLQVRQSVAAYEAARP